MLKAEVAMEILVQKELEVLLELVERVIVQLLVQGVEVEVVVLIFKHPLYQVILDLQEVPEVLEEELEISVAELV
jgi:hypothetical protein